MKLINRLYWSIRDTILVFLYLHREKDYDTIVFGGKDDFEYNSKYFFHYLINNIKDKKVYYIIENNELRIKLNNEVGDHFINFKSKENRSIIYNAGCLISSNAPVLFSGLVTKKRLVINFYHGLPLKCVGLKAPNSKLYKFFYKRTFHRMFTYMISNSSKMQDVFKESFNIKDRQFRVLGQPRNDALLNPNSLDSLTGLYGNDLPFFKKTILYAPTWRINEDVELFPFSDFNLDEIEGYLEKNEIMIFIRYHSQSFKESKDSFFTPHIRYLNDDKINDIMAILNIFDLLITDYSSIYFDYMLLERPIIFLPYDYEQYCVDSGLNFDYFDITPGAKPKTQKEFLDSIQEAFFGMDLYKEKRSEVNLRFNEIKKDNCNNCWMFINEELINLKMLGKRDKLERNKLQ